jgi:hypothetical protein
MIEAAVKGSAEIARLQVVKIKVELGCDAGTYIHTARFRPEKFWETIFITL